ncbi:MAG: xanthine dehydrogenase family protein molybdopterin-binding subunit [Burkholderiales bacterium]
MLRTEDDRLLRGAASFLDDIETGPGTSHVAFVRSPYAHALVRSVNTAGARSMASVVAAYSAPDFAGVIKPIVADFEAPGFNMTVRPVLAADRVRFVGDLLAMIVATDPYAAVDAAEAIELDLESCAAVIETSAAIAPGAPRVHASIIDNVVFEGRFASENFDRVQAPLRLRECFTASRIAAVSMEPRGCIARFDAPTGLLTMWTSSQVPHMVMSCLAEHLGLRESDIRVIVPEVGGGFGMKAAVYPEELLVAAAAMRLRVPVKWVQDRFDDFLTSNQARDHRYDMDVGFDRDGRLISVSTDILVNIGAYASLPFGSSLEANGGPRNMPGPYQLRNFRYRTRAVVTHTCPTGAYRGVSAPLACLAMEGMLDRIARYLGLDPAEVRRRNLVHEFPYRNVLGQDYPEGCFAPALERALDLADYPAVRKRPNAPDRVHGVAVAVVTEQTGMGAARYKARGLYRVPGFESASVKMETDGSVTACISQAAQGQGHATAFAQIVSDRLGVPVADIRIIEGDTARTPFGTGTFGSRGIVLAGNALNHASNSVRDKMARIAASVLECDPGDIELRDGYARVIGVPKMQVSVRDIASVAYSSGKNQLPAGEHYGLEATNYHDTPSAVIGSAVHVAAVSIDTRTGNVRVDRYVVIHDCGRMINPALVDGQIHGATAQALGEVLMESIHFDEAGQPLVSSLMDYQLPRAIDVLPMTIEAMHTEIGGQVFKGIGESGIIAGVPALTNAIADALSTLGINVTSLPLTAMAIRTLIRNARR